MLTLAQGVDFAVALNVALALLLPLTLVFLSLLFLIQRGSVRANLMIVTLILFIMCCHHLLMNFFNRLLANQLACAGC